MTDWITSTLSSPAPRLIRRLLKKDEAVLSMTEFVVLVTLIEPGSTCTRTDSSALDRLVSMTKVSPSLLSKMAGVMRSSNDTRRRGMLVFTGVNLQFEVGT